MLKKQGIVIVDPLIPVDHTLIPSPPARPKNPIFEDEERSKTLAKLLKSKNPEDLQEANQLIQCMVKEDEVRMQRASKRAHTLEEVNNNVKLLQEMLLHYHKEDSSDGDKDLMRELFERCETKRLTLFKMAGETEDNDRSLGDILQASDNLSRVINWYRKVVEGEDINGEFELPDLCDGTESVSRGIPTLIDLGGFEAPSPTVDPVPIQAAPEQPQQPPQTLIPILPPPPLLPVQQHSGSAAHTNKALHPMNITSSSVSVCLLDEELLFLGLEDASRSESLDGTPSSKRDEFQVEKQELDFFAGRPLSSAHVTPLETQALLPAGGAIAVGSQASLSSYPPLLTAAPANPLACGGVVLGELDMLGAQILEEARGASGRSVSLPVDVSPVPASIPANPTNLLYSASAIPPLSSIAAPPGSPLFSSQGSPHRGPAVSLASVNVPLESIKPSSLLPVTAYDKSGFRILLHFAKECPPLRPDVLVVVVSMLNTAPLPIRNILLQAAVPKTMKVKLQPPSGTELALFNPIQPPAAITQVMLLANPQKERVRLRYKLSFSLGEETNSEVFSDTQDEDLEGSRKNRSLQ
uniref:Golgi associated, gamma adaptin ear containing, ARF binding protein 3 n=1 Tax=Leptobrachium leishanense TaxID=445787 RepID=A0A8C5QKF6_9ANUR